MEAQMPHPLVIAWDKYRNLLRKRIFQVWSRTFGERRPSNYPYTGGDSFRAIADHIYDETGKCDPADVKAGDTVFVSMPFIEHWLRQVHPLVKYPYVLIEHNGDADIDKNIVDLLDDKIVNFYAQDAVYEDSRVTPIPIGIENRWIYMAGIPHNFKVMERRMRRHPPVKKNKILFRFSIYTNRAVREPLLAYFKKQSIMETFTHMLSPTLHMQKLVTYKFVASPPGNSIESSRTWEAFELRTVPIVKDYFAYRAFKARGLPMWIVKDWNELEGLTEADLARKYDELMATADFSATRMDYWIDLIRKDQKTAHDRAASQGLK